MRIGSEDFQPNPLNLVKYIAAHYTTIGTCNLINNRRKYYQSTNQ